MRDAKMLQVMAVAGMLVGCAHSTPAPNEKLAATNATIRAAQAVGAQTDPQAALALKLAQDQTEQARQLIANGEHRRAESMLVRANADAELAIALSREAVTRKQAEEALRLAQTLLRGQSQSQPQPPSQ